MQIKSLQIKNYKAYGENSDKIEFEIPDNQNPASGLTVFVGPNNSGKSTTFDALLKFDENKRVIDEDKRIGGIFEIKITDKDGKLKIVTTNDQSSQIVISGESTWTREHIEFVPSRRPWNYRFSGSTTLDAYRNYKYQQERIYSIDNQLAPLLDFIHRNKKNDFTLLMKKVIPSFFKWNIKTDRQGDYISYSFEKTNIEHDIDLLGDGTINLFAIIAYLLEQNPDKILIIDEPELSLHPEAQRRLFTILKERSKDKQIILSTHSPYFVDSDVIASIRKFELNNLGPEVKINRIREKLSVKEPAVFSFWHRDLFFAETAIFVEGPEDYVRLKKHILQEGKSEITHVIYPIYGKRNKDFFKKFCDAFGIKHCFIFDVDCIENDVKHLFDGGITTDLEGTKKKKWYRENFSKFENIYKEKKGELQKQKIFIWSKPDVEDILDQDGNSIVGMEDEVKECVKFIYEQLKVN